MCLHLPPQRARLITAALKKLPATTECEQLWGPGVLPNSRFCVSLDSLRPSYLQSILVLAGKRQNEWCDAHTLGKWGELEDQKAPARKKQA